MANSLPQSKPSALLIGSAACNVDSKGKLLKGVVKKAGIRTVFKSGQPLPKDMWVNVDLNSMQTLMDNREIDVFQKYNYREQYADRNFALGKYEIIGKIRKFFRQKDRTKFVLYYSGHGDEDGSWCFPRTKDTDSSNPARAPEPEPARTAPASHERITIVEVHGAANNQDGPSGDEECRENDGSSPESDEARIEDALDESQRATDASPYVTESFAYQEAIRQRPPPYSKTNDLLTFEEVIKIWDDTKRQGQPNRSLMIILDCCYSGRWVEKLRGSTDGHQRRDDICIQAACQPFERSNVADSQEGSVFTKRFVAAQSQTLPKKLLLSLIDHLMVLNVVTFANNPFRGFLRGNGHTPMCSQCAPFAGIQFFASFEDMYLTT